MDNNIFTGKWICDPRFSALKPLNMYHREHEPPVYGGDLHDELKNIHTLFRRCFDLRKQAGRYTLTVSADDYAKIYVNGVLVGQGPRTGYIEAYHYNRFDLTDALVDGRNEIRIHAYYQGEINHVWISGDLRMGVIADITDPAGQVILSTDGDWECAPIPHYTSMRTVGYKTQYLEDYDSRLPLPAFEPVGIRQYVDTVFVPTPSENLAVYDRRPVLCERLPGGGLFYDFGTELTGTLNIMATGRAGDSIRILCGEETDGSEVRVRHAMRCNCDYDETWTLADGDNTLEQFDYKAFRYVTLVPSDAHVTVGDLTATVRHMTFDDEACRLTSDDERLEAIFNICKNGVKYGTQEVYVDCPSREKGQYAGDMTVTSAAQLWLTGNKYMLENGILDQAFSARIDDGLMAVMSGGQMQEIADYSLQFPILLLRHYSFTKDKTFLRSMLPVAERMLAHFARYARKDGLLDGVCDKWNLVDWPGNLRDDYDFPLKKPIGAGVHNVINAFYIGAVMQVEEIRTILELPCERRSDALIRAFDAAFFRPERGLYADAETSEHCSVHANMLPAFYGFVRAGYETSVGDLLAQRGLVCGVYMAYFLLKGLCRLGRHEDAYRLMCSDGAWYNMVREGGTTCFEAWGVDQKWNTSLCHPWASTPISLIIEDFFGVSPDGTVGECRLPCSAGRTVLTVPTAGGRLTLTANS